MLTVPPQWACTVFLAIIGLWAGAPPAVVLTLFLAFSFFNAMYNTLTGVYPGEVFPTEIRGIGTGFAAAGPCPSNCSLGGGFGCQGNRTASGHHAAFLTECVRIGVGVSADGAIC